VPGPDFVPDADNPAYILVDDAAAVAGAVCLMMTPRFRAVGRARFRILHALEPSLEHYRALTDAVRAHATDLPEHYLFLPEARTAEGAIMLDLGFVVQRRSWEMRRGCTAPAERALPHGYAFRAFEPGIDDAEWVRVVNSAFASLRGHADCGPDFVAELLAEPGHWPEGMVLLTYEGAVVGLVRVLEEEVEAGVPAAFIGPIAVMDGHRGRGLGRALLRIALSIGQRRGQRLAVLTVNAENDKAVELYAKEGFEKHVVMVCYSTVA
jgi:mycothiol synthase